MRPRVKTRRSNWSDSIRDASTCSCSSGRMRDVQGCDTRIAPVPGMAFLPGDGGLVDDVRYLALASDQSRSSTIGEVAEQPFGANQQSIPEPNQLPYVNHSPHQPGQETRKLHTLDLGDGTVPPNRRQATAIVVHERLVGVAPNRGRDVPRDPLPFLDRHRRHAGKWLVVLVPDTGGVADHENLRVPGNVKLPLHRHASRAIEFRNRSQRAGNL